MKKEKNELLKFLGGLAMLVVGLYLLMDRVYVSNSWFCGRLFGVSWMSSGLVVVPFIIGVVMLFVNNESFFSKLVTGLGLLLIVVSIITSTRLILARVTLFDWIVILVLIFGGFTNVMKVLLKNPAKKGDKERRSRKY